MLRTEQNPSIPDSIRRHYKGAVIDTRRPNHDHVQAMTAVEGFWGKWIAVNPLDTLVFSMTQHQTAIQSKMTLALGWFLEFQGPEESSHLKHNMYNKYKTYNTFCIKNYIILIFLTTLLLLSTGLEQGTAWSLESDLTARPRIHCRIQHEWGIYMQWT